MDIRVINWYAYGETIINPFALGFTLCMGILMIILCRRNAVIPMLIASLFITEMQRIVIFTLDFDMIRILIIFGWIRVITKGEIKSLKLNIIDKCVIGYAVVGIIIYTILWGTSKAFINRLGAAFNTIGLFFLFRILIKDFEDIKTILKALSIIVILLSLAMIIENRTRYNFFSIFGGVHAITALRGGRLRCQGPFMHPILAGVFGATLVPLFVGSYFQEKKIRFLSILGISSAVIITILSASSGPVMALISGIIAICLWPLRYRMRFVKFGAAALLIALHLYMKAPVWALVARVGTVSGSTGYHRFILIDQFIRRFNKWFLLGVKTTAYWGWGLQDITNQFILVATQGGILTLILFIAVIVLCFRTIGRGIRVIKEEHTQFMVWSLGSALFTHIVSFFGVSYFDQIIISWYLLLSIISTVRSITYIEPVANVSNTSSSQMLYNT